MKDSEGLILWDNTPVPNERENKIRKETKKEKKTKRKVSKKSSSRVPVRMDEGGSAGSPAGASRTPGHEEGGMGVVQVVVLVVVAERRIAARVHHGSRRGRPRLPVQLLSLPHVIQPHFALLRLGGVEGEGGRGRAQLVEVDHAQPGGISGELDHDEPVHEERGPDDFDPLRFPRHGLADEEDVREEEAVDVHLGGSLIPELEPSLDEEVPPLVVRAEGHGPGEVQVAVNLDEPLHLLVLGFHGIVGLDPG